MKDQPTPQPIESVEQAADNYAEHLDPNSTGKQMIDAYKAFIAGAQWQSRHGWVDVKDRLPEIGEEYNVVMDLDDGYEPVSSTLEYDSISKTWSYPGTDIIVDKVLFWQPLPLPPNQTTK